MILSHVMQFHAFPCSAHAHACLSSTGCHLHRLRLLSHQPLTCYFQVRRFASSMALESHSAPSLFFSAYTQLNATSTTCPLLSFALSFAQHKYGVVREYVGHGVGKAFHSAPSICHFRNTNNEQMQLWQTFTIEPMLVQVRKTE